MGLGEYLEKILEPQSLGRKIFITRELALLSRIGEPRSASRMAGLRVEVKD
jgi:hypothetical protein